MANICFVFDTTIRPFSIESYTSATLQRTDFCRLWQNKWSKRLIGAVVQCFAVKHYRGFLIQSFAAAGGVGRRYLDRPSRSLQAAASRYPVVFLAIQVVVSYQRRVDFWMTYARLAITSSSVSRSASAKPD
jgi:hypothetical protein